MKIFDRKGMYRFVRYISVGVSTFLFDIFLIYIATEFFSVAYYIATPIAFIIAITINYWLSRKVVFKGTQRKVHHGYVFYIVVGGGGAFVITALVALLVEYFGFPFLIARVCVSTVLGMCGYIFNLYFNFKVVGKHH